MVDRGHLIVTEYGHYLDGFDHGVDRLTGPCRLRRTATLLKPGGSLVYSTCSLEPEENTGVIQQFLASHPNWKLTAERQLLPLALIDIEHQAVAA